MLSPSVTRYLLAIYQISNGGDPVRSVDVANWLDVSRSSVSSMLKTLARMGYVQKEYYGDVLFTPEGVRTAGDLYTRYAFLRSFFLECLGVEELTAGEDAVACICAISDESMERLADFTLDSVGRAVG